MLKFLRIGLDSRDPANSPARTGLPGGGLKQSSFDLLIPPVPQAGASKIVFASTREGDMQIFVMNADGSGLTRLTYSGAHDDYPRWSPNGTKILFQSDRDNATTDYMDIYVMNANGSGVTRLTANVNDNCLANWSPDGSKITFQSLRNGPNYQVYSMNADGSNQVNLTYTSSNDVQPSWSPDGSKIAFASDRDHSGYASVFVMNATGSGQTRLTFNDAPFIDEQPAWSRDGSKIAFASTRDSILEQWQETDDFEIPEDDGQIFYRSLLHINKEIYVMNASGSGQTRLTNELANDEWPSWSPDGSKIVFTSDRDRESADPTAQVWTMNADGTGLANISNNGAGEYSASWASGSSNQSPVASAGGSYSGIVSQNVPFHGNGSFDPDGSVVGYAWTFGDGGTGSGVAPTHAYAATGTYNVTLTVADNQGAQGYASTTVIISSSSSDQYAVNFLQQGLGRSPNQDEGSYWTDIMRSAYAQGQSSMLLAMTEFGMTVFESAEYAGRGRSDRDYVNDLYRTYLMREPEYCDPNDPYCGPNYWATQALPLHMGRSQVRNAFESSGEFHSIVATLTASGSPSAAASSLATAQVDLFNQSGNQVQARDCEWGIPLVSLPGRAGLDLGLSLSYSSLVWTRSGPYIYFGQDNESLSPGFAVGFPTIQSRKFNAQTGRNVYIFTAAGRHVELRQVGTSSLYEAADSSYLQLTEGGSTLSVRSTDGTQIDFENKASGWRAKQVEDRNGNIISITNDWRGDIQNIVDTLGRTLYFNYDGNSNLIEIKQDWNGLSQAHTWVTFGWGNTPSMQMPSGAQAVGTYASDSPTVITQVGFADGSRYNFEYNAAAQVNLIRKTSDSLVRSQTVYNYGAPDDSTRLTNIRVSADNWTNTEVLPASYVETQFNLEGATHTFTIVGDPSGTVYKEFYGTGWKKGLVTATETWGKRDPQHSVDRQRWTATSWVQDDSDPNALYRTNPRVTATDVYDNSNHAHTEIGYTTFNLPYSNASCSLPSEVYEYDGQNVVRRTHTDYLPHQDYLIRRIIGLPQTKLLYEGTSVLKAKTTYAYDSGGEYLQSTSGTPTQHDGSLSTDPSVRRGNLVAVQRWNVDYPNDGNRITQTTIGYDITGNVIFTRDALGYQNTVSYLDNFSDGGNSRSTFAYPTMIKDPDWNPATAPNNYSIIEYSFDHGGKTLTQGPPPAGQPQGLIQAFTYDDAIRPLQVTTGYNGARVRYIYGSNNIVTLSSVNQLDDAYSNTVFDGFGRVVGVATNNPGSAAGYKAHWTAYDMLGRMMKQSNPTEINGSWSPAGDDLYNPSTGQGGRVYTEQTYDWKGRPLETINQADGTMKYISYDGCGCAGGEIVMLTDEMGRQQRVYSDVLGRQWKTEILQTINNVTSVYSTTTNTLNALDQITNVRVADNTTGSYQDTTMSYDGYGRLWRKHVPEQSPGYVTEYAYNPDDTLTSVTDARGAVANYIYNNHRHLVNGIHYNASGITPTADVTFGYDAVGNGTSMTDGSGNSSYTYDSLSRMISETHTITGAGTYGISYQYNLANQLILLTAPNNITVQYGHDSIGRLISVAGSGASGTSNFASNLQYRAWGAIKHEEYGNGRSMDANYNTRMQVTSFQVPGVMSKTYQYWNDGRLVFSSDLLDHHFDRSYHFNQVGQMDWGLSGAEARGEGASANRPYWETFGYDGIGHLTERHTYQWSSAQMSTSDSYTNNRHYSNGTDWQYDADGRLTMSPYTGYDYDAAGRISTVWRNGSTDLTLDGDGQQVKSFERFWDPVTATETPTTTYYVRSTVLGGAVVAEMIPASDYTRTFVYANGAVLATQIAGAGGFVWWEHRDPSNASYRTTSTSNPGDQAELDPSGANMGTSDTTYHQSVPEEGSLSPYPSFNSGANLGTTYSADGIPIPQDEFFQTVGTLMHGSFGVVESFARASAPRLVSYSVSYYHGRLTRDFGLNFDKAFNEALEQGNLTRNWAVSDNWGFNFEPQQTQAWDVNSPLKVSHRKLTEGERAVFDRVFTTITKQEDCAHFIEDILAQASAIHTENRMISDDIGGLFQSVANGGGFFVAPTAAYSTTTGSMEDGTAAIYIKAQPTFQPDPKDYPRGVYLRASTAYLRVTYTQMALVAIHELLHVAGFNDRALADAVAGYNHVQPIAFANTWEGTLAASKYWDAELSKHCH